MAWLYGLLMGPLPNGHSMAFHQDCSLAVPWPGSMACSWAHSPMAIPWHSTRTAHWQSHGLALWLAHGPTPQWPFHGIPPGLLIGSPMAWLYGLLMGPLPNGHSMAFHQDCSL